MSRLKVLGVGGAAREHAIAKKLFESEEEPRIYWASENINPGIKALCEASGGAMERIKTTDPEGMVELARRWGIDIVFVGPEEPNFYGVPDAFRRKGIPCIGATKRLAMIEMSKAELRRLQWEYDIPGKLLFKTFRSANEAIATLSRYSDTLTWLQNVALKPARQAGGRGVKVIDDRQLYLHQEKERFKFQHAGWIEGYMRSYEGIEDKILVEEKVWGPEYTLQCFTDGKSLLPLPLVQDNKNAHEFDIGSETGGMGSIAGPGVLLPFIEEEEYRKSIAIIEAIVKAIQDKVGEEYCGVVAGQMMLTEVEGPTVIEMYSRLGDPEALNVLAMMKGDLVKLCEALIDGRLGSFRIEWEPVATVVKAIAPMGYPDHRELAKGHPVKVDAGAIVSQGCELYWGSVHEEGGRIISQGSRLVELLAKASSLQEASSKLELCIEYVKLEDGWGLFHRSDIGSERLLKKRLDVAERVRRLYRYREEKGTLGRRLDWLPGVGAIDPARLLRRELMGERCEE